LGAVVLIVLLALCFYAVGKADNPALLETIGSARIK